MDISYDCELNKQCFKCEPEVLNNLNIENNSTNSTIILWNKYQIFVYENREFDTASKIIIPEFQIRNLITSNNFIICLDYSGNIHTTSLKFKNAQKKLKFIFLPREQSIEISTLFSVSQTVSLKFESHTYCLYVNRINTEFTIEKKLTLQCENNILPVLLKIKCILKSFTLSKDHFQEVKKLFNTMDVHDSRHENKIIILTVDKMNVFACLLSSNLIEDHTKLIKLYSCPSDICNIEVVESDNLTILIGLTIGTVVKISLDNINSPKIIHLNTAISKLYAFKNTILYSDGISLWKAEILKSDELKFNQFFVKQIKDFIKLGDQILCTTFMNLIYTFSIDHDESYLKPETDSDYCPAAKLFSNYDYLNKILDEVKKNDSLSKILNKEKNYITALSLSNRQDIMDKVIEQKVFVYESYEDAVAENNEMLLTNNYAEYFNINSLFFLIKIHTLSDNKLTTLLSSTLGDMKIHIALNSDGRILKTTSITIVDQLQIMNILIPLEEDKFKSTKINVDIKIMCNIPGAFDSKKKLWTILYRKTVILNSEHFIKFNTNLNRNISLKVPQKTLEDQIMQTFENQHGNLFEFTNILKNKPLSREWDMYVRLPANYQNVFNEEYCQNHLNSKKTKYMMEQLTSENFLKAKSNIILTVGNEKLRIEVHNDGFSNPFLKIISDNLIVTLHIRNFLSDLIYYDKNNLATGKEFVSHSFYITVENLQRALRNCISGSTQEDILTLIEQFERNVIGVLPI